MRIGYVRLINYIGILNGLGLNEIYIDFSKSKNRIVLIKGDNGCGKSELFRSLHMFPDSNNRLVPGVKAVKEISYIIDDIIYYIKIIYDIKKDKSRDTTKAYITKVTPFGKDELNPNGNISSYKDIIYSEFSLDANFISLMELSYSNRGLADKTPSERKKYVNNIINSLQVYNNIYKTISKRSSVFKSFVNSLVTKLNNIGDVDKLKLLLKSYENRLNSMMNEKDTVIEYLAELKSKVKLIDPDGSIQSTYDKIYNELNDINNKKEGIINNLNKLLTKDIDIEDINNIYMQSLDLKKSIKMNIDMYKNNLEQLLYLKEDISKELQQKQAEIDRLNINIDFDKLKDEVNLLKDNIINYESVIDKIGIDCNNITKEEFVLGLNTLKDIKDSILSFKSNASIDIIEQSIIYYKENSYPDIEKSENELEELHNKLLQLKSQYQEYLMLETLANKIEMRPSNCTIDECPFISESLKASNQNPKEKIKYIQKDISKVTISIEQLKLKIQKDKEVITYINILNSLIRNINNHSNILLKLPIDKDILNTDILLEYIVNGYDIKQIDELYKYIEYSNIIDLYKIEKEKYIEYSNELNINSEKEKILKNIKHDIINIKTRLNNIDIKIVDIQNKIKEDTDKLESIDKDIILYNQLMNLQNEKNKLIDNKREVLSRFNCIKSNIVIIKDCINNIKITQNKLDNINKQIKPIIDERDKIKHSINLALEYTEELKLYNLKYEKIETIKHYSSPSKGIQTLFMLLYMNKTINMANELLSLMFDGKFKLGNFVINESEFRIPCVGNNIQNDDISSMSSAQICMISMILSFVMLKQSSTQYNILKMDEIDAALDTNNRIIFINIIDQLIEILSVEQCIMISHNTEMDTSNCDIIQLKMENNDYISGNIIYKY